MLAYSILLGTGKEVQPMHVIKVIEIRGAIFGPRFSAWSCLRNLLTLMFGAAENAYGFSLKRLLSDNVASR
jgi:hypothetical protein